MDKKDFTRELIAAVVTVGVAWYMSEPRPNPAAAFWFYSGRYAKQFSEYASHKYISVIGSYYNG